MRWKYWYVPLDCKPGEVEVGGTFRMVTSPVGDKGWRVTDFVVTLDPHPHTGNLQRWYTQVSQRALTAEEAELFSRASNGTEVTDERMVGSLPPGTFD